MERIRQLAFPGILIGLLLLANLLPLKLDRAAVTPTPAPPSDKSTTLTYPDLPGRLIFRSDNELQLLEHRKVRSVPLSAAFDLTEDPRSAFSPNGRWVAGFNRMGDQSFLVAVDLTTESVTPLMPTMPGQMRWSPSSQRLAMWAGAHLALVGLKGGDPTRIVLEETIHDVAWAPDESQLAVVVGPTEVDRQSVVLIDVATSKSQVIAERSEGPFWAPNGEGLLFIRHLLKDSLTTELVLRRPDGQEVVLADVAKLLQSNPEVAAIQGAKPTLFWIGGDINPASILFTLKYYSDVNPRFAIGSVGLQGGPVRLSLLPVYPDHPENQRRTPPQPCNTGPVYPSMSSLLFIANGPGCDKQLRGLDRDSWTLTSRVWPIAASGLIAPDGDYWLNQAASGTMPTATRFPLGTGQLVPLYGKAIHWDRG